MDAFGSGLGRFHRIRDHRGPGCSEGSERARRRYRAPGPGGTTGLLLGLKPGWLVQRERSFSECPQLQAAWVPDTDVLYIGRTEQGKRCNRGLATRLKELQRFGQGAAIGHWGGRYLWQIKDSDQLLVAWQESCDPPTREADLVKQFVTAWGARPFANRNRPQRRPIPSRSCAD